MKGRVGGLEARSNNIHHPTLINSFTPKTHPPQRTRLAAQEDAEDYGELPEEEAPPPLPMFEASDPADISGAKSYMKMGNAWAKQGLWDKALKEVGRAG